MNDRLRRAVGVAVTAAVFICSFAVATPATLRVGSDVSGAPFEYYPPHSHVPLGFDIDLIAAIAKAMDSTLVISNHQFDDLIAAIRRGQFDAGMSAMSDTSKREQRVDFLDYFVAGGGIVVPKGNPARIFSLAGLCGYSVAVESGTSYEQDLDTQSAACRRIGLGPIHILTYPTDDDSFAAFINGKSSAYVADYPVGVYRARTVASTHPIEVVGRQFDVVPYGIAVAKANVALRNRLQLALLKVVADGTYDRLLAKWGLDVGGMRFAPVNAGKLYETVKR
ncbi:MAG TPA: ABC transporter substrate-binding protein [Candidatus Acidoferrales bacterium]|nr:ABC transporter substrate-binding protein [Candidatus Acidoferrales bacterium]